MYSKKVSHAHLLLAIGIICISIATIIGLKSASAVRHRPLPIPRQTDTNIIENWMTIPYIAHAYRVSLADLFKALEVDGNIPRNHNLNLSAIAKNKGVDELSFLSKVKDTVNRLQVASQNQ